MDRANRGLAEGLQRVEEPRFARHPDCGGRWLARLPRSDRGGSSGRPDPDLHRASDPQFAKSATAEAAAAALDAFSQSDWGRKFPPWWQYGRVNGNRRSRSSPIRPRCVAREREAPAISCRIPTPLKACPCSCARSSRTAATSPATKPPASCCIWPCATSKDWKMPPITWRQAVNQFAILFGERFTSAII
ncbi:transposase [Caballeronia humi]|uniref:Transposase n=1 Tax=Caballeronia humi TaxID=326474 RepID=A0A158I803_9BURK|nr:transposase [Caballeronia humi]